MFNIKYLQDSTNFSEYDLERIEHLNLEKWVTNYSYVAYGWTGFLIAKDAENLWFKFELGHCSCYGPLENWYSWKFTKEEMLELIKALDPEEYGDHVTKEEKQAFLDFVINN